MLEMTTFNEPTVVTNTNSNEENEKEMETKTKIYIAIFLILPSLLYFLVTLNSQPILRKNVQEDIRRMNLTIFRDFEPEPSQAFRLALKHDQAILPLGVSREDVQRDPAAIILTK